MSMTESNGDKISINWDELKTRKVETRLKEQDALARNREYSKLDTASLPTANAPKPGLVGRLLNNSVLVLALFGLLGGIAAWACGASLQFRSDVKADAERQMQEIHKIGEAIDKGALTQAEGDLAIAKYTEEARAANPYFNVMTDPRYGDTTIPKAELEARGLERESKLRDIVARDQFKALIRNILAYGASGVMIALFLAIAMPVSERNVPGIIINGSVGAAIGLVGGIIVSLFVDKLRNGIVGSDPTNATRQLIARIAVWGVLGLFLTIGPGLVMRNAKKLIIGLLGGLIGGMVGGALFDWVASQTAGHSSRWAELVAMVAIGVVAGVSTGLIENAAKAGWLRVTSGLIAGKQFILYRNPTFVGSGPDCQIYLFRDPRVGRRHAAIHIVPGGFELEDLPLGDPTFVNGRTVARARLKNGDRIQIGATTLVFQEKSPS